MRAVLEPGGIFPNCTGNCSTTRSDGGGGGGTTVGELLRSGSSRLSADSVSVGRWRVQARQAAAADSVSFVTRLGSEQSGPPAFLGGGAETF